MTDPSERVQLIGQREFVRDLRRVGVEFPRMVSAAMRTAAKTVEGTARARYTQRFKQGTSGRRTRSVRGIVATASSTQAGVKLDGESRPWLAGQEFGSDRLKQFSPWTGSTQSGAGSNGRFLYPAIREDLPGVVDQLTDDLERIVSAAVGG